MSWGREKRPENFKTGFDLRRTRPSATTEGISIPIEQQRDSDRIDASQGRETVSRESTESKKRESKKEFSDEEGLASLDRIPKSVRSKLEEQFTRKFGDSLWGRMFLKAGIVAGVLASGEVVDYAYDTAHASIANGFLDRAGDSLPSLLGAGGLSFVMGGALSYGLAGLYDKMKIGYVDVFKTRKNGQEKGFLRKVVPAVLVGAVFPARPEIGMLYLRKGVDQFDGMKKKDHATLLVLNAGGTALWTYLFWNGLVILGPSWMSVATVLAAAVASGFVIQKGISMVKNVIRKRHK